MAPVSDEIWAQEGVGTIACGGISSRGLGISDSGRKGIYVNRRIGSKYLSILDNETILLQVYTGLMTLEHIEPEE
jgi:hypothetical protein